MPRFNSAKLRQWIKKNEPGKRKDWRMFYHGTQKKNVPSIQEKGLIAGGGKGFHQQWAGRSAKTIYLGTRGDAHDYASHSSGGALLKVRVPKKTTRRAPHDPWAWNNPGPIHPKFIRFMTRRKKRGGTKD